MSLEMTLAGKSAELLNIDRSNLARHGIDDFNTIKETRFARSNPSRCEASRFVTYETSSRAAQGT